MAEPGELDRAARDVIAAGRDGIAPNDFVAERLRRSVERRLRGSAPPARSRTRTLAVLVAFGAAVLGGALYARQLAAPGEEHTAPPPPARPAPPPVPAPAAAPAPLTRSPVPAPAVEHASPVAHASGAARPDSSKAARSQQLGAEIELLARVNAAVNAGDGGHALALLAEYDRQFKPSILAEERAAASVLALCAAGRTAEARSAGERFAKSSPRSPLLGRISGSCAGTR